MKTLIDLSYILNGTIGIICTVLVLFSIKSNRNLNIYLAMMIFSASSRFILRGFFELTSHTEIIENYSRSIGYVFGFALPYLYIQHLIFPKKTFHYKSLFHFILPTILFIENKCELIEKLIDVELNNVITWFIFAQAIYYFILVYLLLRKHVWKKTGKLEIETEQASLMKRWILVLFIAFTLMAVRLITAILFMQNGKYISDNYFFWINSLTWFVIFVMILTSPSILNGYLTEISKASKAIELQPKQIANWRLKPTSQILNIQDLQLSTKINHRLEDYFLKIDQVIEKENYFLQPGFNLEDLAIKLAIPKSHLNFLFKYHSDMSFSDFKKVIRIKVALQLINEGYLEKNTFEFLAQKVGFSTYNTFYTSFKDVTGLAPQKFMDSKINVVTT